MRFINETKEKDYDQKLSGYEFRLRGARGLLVFFGILFCVVGIVMIIACISERTYEPLGGAIPILLFAPLFILAGIYFKKIFLKTIEKGKQNVAPVTRVTFEESGLEVTVPFNPKKSGYFQYGEISVTEYPEVWVLELPEGKWHTLNKCDMTEGTAEELSAFLFVRLKARYTVEEETIS